MAERCAEASLRVGEPLAGSAAEATRWLAVEEAGAWAPKIFDSPGLGPLAQRLRAWDGADGDLRVQLIRRRGGRATKRRRVFVVDAAAGRVWAHRLDDEGLLALDLEAAFAGQTGEPFDRPLHLVCTHGKRDDCCALRGIPVHRALADAAATLPEAERPEVWQTSHLGGHRFAATLVTLPSGVCLGRVEADEAGELLAAGGLHRLDRVRGRCQWPKAAQVAEVQLRERVGLDAELTLQGVETRPEGWWVRFATGTMDDGVPAGALHEVEVRANMVDTVQPKSCGDEPVAVPRLLAKVRP